MNVKEQSIGLTPDVAEEEYVAEENKSQEDKKKSSTNDDSEYETLEEDNVDNDSIGSQNSHQNSKHSSDLEDGELSDSFLIEDQREDGDGEEESAQIKNKKLDDDEDRRNPQYIPKKGTFYEHDDRTTLDEIESADKEGENVNTENIDKKQGTSVQTGKKGKVWTEQVDRWTHDLYVEEEQGPKSRQEIIETYGYDIRNEEAPPKARRRRRYGRGPNKYTRNWEDEAAYNRSTGTRRKQFQNNREDFPALGGRRRSQSTEDDKKGVHENLDMPKQAQINTINKSVSASLPNQMQGMNKKSRPFDKDKKTVRMGDNKQVHANVPQSAPKEIRIKVGEKNRRIKFVDKEKKIGPAGDAPTKKDGYRSYSEPANNIVMGIEKELPMGRGIGRGRGRRSPSPLHTTSKNTPFKGRAKVITPSSYEKVPGSGGNSLKHAADALAHDFHYMNMNNNGNEIAQENNAVNRERKVIIPQHEIPPRMQDNMAVNSNVGSNRSKRYSTQRQRSLPESATTYSPPPPAAHNMGFYPPGQTAFHNAPPGPVFNEGVPVPPPPATSTQLRMMPFLPSGPPPPYPPPPIINYVPSPAYALPLQPPAVQQAELYQGQGGITYYNTESQAVLPRQTPPRRIKLAIPIVPPPERQPRGRGRTKESSPTQEQQLDVNKAA